MSELRTRLPNFRHNSYDCGCLRQETNPEQYEAITHESGPCMVLAGPGSGKTFVITKHVLFLIQSLLISPSRILVITFTNAAANEMRERFLRMCDDKVHFCTIHSLCLHLINLQCPDQPYQYLSEEAETNILLQLAMDLYPKEFRREDAPMLRRAIREDISQRDPIYHTLARELAKYKQDRRLATFSDMESLAHENLSSFPFLYDHILIDEFQDMNQKQYEIVRGLLPKPYSFFAVGDDDQSIYGFRGANPYVMQQFLKDYPDTHYIKLNRNYRSKERILKVSANLIGHNRNRLMKTLHSGRKDSAGGEVLAYEYPNSILMLKELKNRILRKRELGEREIAVLVRTNLHGAMVANFLRNNGIPIRSMGGMSVFHKHPVIMDLLAYFHLSNRMHGRKDWLRILNHPNRYLSRKCLENGDRMEDILYYYRKDPKAYREVLRLQKVLKYMAQVPPKEAIEILMKMGEYRRYIREETRGNSLLQNEYEEVLEYALFLASRCENQIEFEELLEICDPTLSESEGAKEDAVVVGTYHGAKGLEYRTVELPFLQEGIVPHRKASDPEEERRLFYVAVTRAKDSCILSFVCENTKKEKASKLQMKPSPFLAELGIVQSGYTD